MLNPRLASRYAKSLIDLAVEQNALETTLQDVQLIENTIRRNPEFAVVLRSPVIKADKKNAVIDAVLGPHLSTLTRSFIRLLTSKGREDTLAEMVTSFIAQYRTMKHISQVRLITAAPVSEDVKEGIRSRVAASMPGQTVELSTDVQPDLIGGFVLEMGDKLVDASIRRDLNDVKKQFLKNLYVPDLR
jgi:F-type H+-transporting ATPase subunit delta